MELQGYGGVDECAMCHTDQTVYEWVTTSGAVKFICMDCKPIN